MNKEIEEMQFIMLNAVDELYSNVNQVKKNHCGEGDKRFLDEAKALYNAGYRKQVWHKAEDELPGKPDIYLCYCKVNGYDRNNNYIDTVCYKVSYFDGKQFDLLGNFTVIAWVDNLLKYEVKND